MSCKVNIMWDEEASVYIATSDDVPGLVLESGSYDALLEKVRFAIRELLTLNNKKADIVDLTIISERHYLVSNG